MKILVVTPYYAPKIGGLENYAHQLNLALTQLGDIEIVVATSQHARSKTMASERVDGLKVYRLPRMFKLSNTPVNLSWPSQLRRLIAAERPDLIMAHTPVPGMADAAALAAGSTPFVVVYHAATLKKDHDPIFNLLARGYSWLQHLTLSRAQHIFAVSGFVKDQFSPSLKLRTSVLPNSVWTNELATRNQPAGASFIFIGSLDKTHSWKGLGLILSALHDYQTQYGPAHLTIVGEGNGRDIYENQVHELKLTSAVTFTGALTGAAKFTELTAATALIAYPTTANDAFPTVFLEAWSKQVPVIAAAIGPIPSLIDDHTTGYLAPAHNPQELATVMHHVATDANSRRAVADQAFELVKNNYTWERQAQEFRAQLEELL